MLRAEDGGALPERNQTVEFRLYDSPDGETALWGRTVAVLLDENGLFNAELSDSAGSTAPGAPGTGLAGVFAANADKSLFVGLTVVGTSGEIAPRQKILPVPYAVFASDVASASGDFAAAGVLTAASATFSGGVSAASLDVAEIPGGFELRLGGRGARVALANIAPSRVEGAKCGREGFFSVLSAGGCGFGGTAAGTQAKSHDAGQQCGQ